MSCQVGALMKLVMQLKGQRHALGQTAAQLKEKIADELADIINDTLFIAHELGIDIDRAFDAMLESDKKKIAARKV